MSSSQHYGRTDRPTTFTTIECLSTLIINLNDSMSVQARLSLFLGIKGSSWLRVALNNSVIPSDENMQIPTNQWAGLVDPPQHGNTRNTNWAQIGSTRPTNTTSLQQCKYDRKPSTGLSDRRHTCYWKNNSVFTDLINCQITNCVFSTSPPPQRAGRG